jgi:hypothetical protein
MPMCSFRNTEANTAVIRGAAKKIVDTAARVMNGNAA